MRIEGSASKEPLAAKISKQEKTLESPQDRPERQNHSERPDGATHTGGASALTRRTIKQQKQNRKRRRIGWTIAGALALILAGAVVYYALGAAIIPEAAAYSAELEDGDPCSDFAEFSSSCAVSYEHSDEVARDGLISQTPAPGFSLTKPGQIKLVYSSGPAESEFPDIIRQDYGDAVERLYLAGIEVSEVKSVERPDLGPNRVVSASIEAGTLTKSGAKVTLEVSTETVALPDLTGLTQEQAELDLQRLGFDPEIIEESSIEPVGTVIGQEPEAGEVAKGSKVTVKIAAAEDVQRIKVPTVVGLTEDEASGLLAAAGFKSIAVVQVESSKVTDERVSHVVPGEGRFIRSNSNVVIVVTVPEK